MGKCSALVLAAATAVAAQGQLAVDSPTSVYHGRNLTGRHIGAAQDLMTVPGAGAGDSLRVNGTLGSGQHYLLDASIVSTSELPCGVISEPSVSSNAGPLQCGASNPRPQDFFQASPGTLVLGISGINAWWVCTVNTNGPYGLIPNTIVGTFGAGSPNGPGISGCSAIDALTFGFPRPAASPSSSTSVPMTTAPPGPVPTNGTMAGPHITTTITTKMCPECPDKVVTVTSCPYDQQASYYNNINKPTAVPQPSGSSVQQCNGQCPQQNNQQCPGPQCSQPSGMQTIVIPSPANPSTIPGSGNQQNGQQGGQQCPGPQCPQQGSVQTVVIPSPANPSTMPGSGNQQNGQQGGQQCPGPQCPQQGSVQTVVIPSPASPSTMPGSGNNANVPVQPAGNAPSTNNNNAKPCLYCIDNAGNNNGTGKGNNTVSASPPIPDYKGAAVALSSNSLGAIIIAAGVVIGSLIL